MTNGEPIINKIELVTHNDLSVGWYTTTKLPLFDRTGKVVGLEGVTRELKAASEALGPYPVLAKVVDFVEQHLADRIKTTALAREAGLTVRTLERLFQRRFRMSPFAHVERVRINEACRRLTQSSLPIAHIATAFGFCDQSYMTGEFARLLHMTPHAYSDLHAA